MVYLHLDGRSVAEDIVGVGGSGLIIRQGRFAVKIPRLWMKVDVPEDGRLTPVEGDFDIRRFRIDQVKREKAIFRRLVECPGIVSCFDLDSSNASIRMEYMKNGDLRNHLARENPDKEKKLRWLTEMAHTLANIHHWHVIVADLRLDNFLLDNDLSIKYTDFGESSLMPVDWNMKDPNEDGESVSTDIGNFGAVMFEIITGQDCRFDLMQNWKEPGDPFTWPRRESLPSTAGVWLGHIIEACWTEGSFTSADELVTALSDQHIDTKDAEIGRNG